VSVLLLGAGVIIGLAVASDLGWLPFGHAVPDQVAQPSAPLPTPVAVPPSVMSGSDQNFVRIAKAVTPAVVNISTTRQGKEGGQGQHGTPFDDPFFRRFFGDEFFRRFESRRNERNVV